MFITQYKKKRPNNERNDENYNLGFIVVAKNSVSNVSNSLFFGDVKFKI